MSDQVGYLDIKTLFNGRGTSEDSLMSSWNNLSRFSRHYLFRVIYVWCLVNGHRLALHLWLLAIWHKKSRNRE